MQTLGIDMPIGSLLVLAAWRAAPRHLDTVIGIALEVEEATRKESGCVFFNAANRLSEPECFSLVECYRTPEDFSAHRASKHFHDIVLARLVPLLEERTVSTYLVGELGVLHPVNAASQSIQVSPD